MQLIALLGSIYIELILLKLTCMHGYNYKLIGHIEGRRLGRHYRLDIDQARAQLTRRMGRHSEAYTFNLLLLDVLHHQVTII